ncbi:hypothetical protein F4604DRAFT_1686351 [Suillus subluteus]|nr:hypothetical protein F4604DRAFT_1686351 [Suillus subluteus]
MSEMLRTVFVVARPRILRIMRAVGPTIPGCNYCRSMKIRCRSRTGEACIACQQRCSYVEKQAQDPLSSDESESDSADESESDSADESESDSADESDCVEQPQDEKKRVRLEAKLGGAKQRLAQMEGMHREFEKACRELEQLLDTLKGRLAG